MAGEAAINYLYDAIFTITATTGGDDGNPVRTPSGSPFTFKADKVSPALGRRLEDHGAGQDEVEFNRTKKLPQKIIVEAKLQKSANSLLAKLLGSGGVVVIFNAVATGGTMTDCVGIVGDVSWDYDAPSTLRFDLNSYGSKWNVST